MPVWDTRPVAAQPSLTLRSWEVIQMPEGGRHFVGWCLDNCEGRVSSPIQEYDPITLKGVTSTGRVYQLHGPPGLDGDAEYVRDGWLAIYGNPTWSEVTAEMVVAAMRKSPTATSTLSALRGSNDKVDDPVQSIAIQTELTNGVVKTFAAISDLANAHLFSKEAARKGFGDVNVLPELGPRKRFVLSRQWTSEGVKFEPTHLAETRQLLISVTKGTQVTCIVVPEKTTRNGVMELHRQSEK